MTQAPQYPAPEADVGYGLVRVRTRDGAEEIRQVLVGQTHDAWEMWAAGARFALMNTTFIELGATVYRTETIDRIDPIRENLQDPTAQALQVALGALTVIANGLGTDVTPQELAHAVVASLEDSGIHLRPQPTEPEPPD